MDASEPRDSLESRFSDSTLNDSDLATRFLNKCFVKNAAPGSHVTRDDVLSVLEEYAALEGVHPFLKSSRRRNSLLQELDLLFDGTTWTFNSRRVYDAGARILGGRKWLREGWQNDYTKD